ncbi:MAG: ABC transporter ATP-binding protein [Clostridia bacterium]|nr:ABC transporter ATP-binding protein [Clostridia bacterium]MDD4542749.1 ABC transporter ATP-binding protein [Clostridia bacterium]
METEKRILELDKVVYEYSNKYQTVKAVNEISYDFQKGRFYAIVGKSGSGKTTLLSLLAGLDVPKEGAVSYMGKPTKDMDRDRYRREDVAVIYQDFNLFPLLTVVENVMYPLQLKGMNEKQAMHIASEKINAVGMDENFYKRFPSMLSGGEQQRIAIARALASGAQIILADEPTGNLDTENGNNIIDILKKLAHDDGYCVIVVTHDLGISADADEVLNMRDGKLII